MTTRILTLSTSDRNVDTFDELLMSKSLTAYRSLFHGFKGREVS